jgi:hypothetical protein
LRLPTVGATELELDGENILRFALFVGEKAGFERNFSLDGGASMWYKVESVRCG